MTASLQKKGNKINHKTVKRIMRKLGSKGKSPRKNKGYSSYKSTIGKVADNILNRQFSVDVPNRVFVTDVTEFNLGSIGKVYLSPVMDLFNREIIGYDIARHPGFAQTKRMMDDAFMGRKIAEGVLFDSDQNWQYQMKEFGEILSGLASRSRCPERETAMTIRSWRTS